MYIYSCIKDVSNQSHQAQSKMSTQTLKSKQADERLRNHKLYENNKILRKQEVLKLFEQQFRFTVHQ